MTTHRYGPPAGEYGQPPAGMGGGYGPPPGAVIFFVVLGAATAVSQ